MLRDLLDPLIGLHRARNRCYTSFTVAGAMPVEEA